MIYSLSLQTVGIVVGVILLFAHLVALFYAPTVQAWAKGFPRSTEMGAVLLTLAACWAFLLVLQVDLGDFTSYRALFLGIIVAGYFLTLFFVREFLAVRALGMLLLLAAEPLLEAAFMRPLESRLLLTVLAYVWVAAGLFWVGMPYLLRDQIGWLARSPLRWRVAALCGALYGAALCFFAVTRWG